MALIISMWSGHLSSKMCIAVKSDLSWFLWIFQFSAIPKLWITSWDPYKVPVVILDGSAPQKQRKVKTLQEKAELFDMYCTLRSAAVVAHNFKINESSVRTIIKKEKEILKLLLQLFQQVWKPCIFCEIHFNAVLKMQL